jgi:hypothetical protein
MNMLSDFIDSVNGYSPETEYDFAEAIAEHIA